MIVFLFSKKIGFDVSCKLSPCMKFQSLFSRKNTKKYFKMSSADFFFLPSMLSINLTSSHVSESCTSPHIKQTVAWLFCLSVRRAMRKDTFGAHVNDTNPDQPSRSQNLRWTFAFNTDKFSNISGQRRLRQNCTYTQAGLDLSACPECLYALDEAHLLC